MTTEIDMGALATRLAAAVLKFPVELDPGDRIVGYLDPVGEEARLDYGRGPRIVVSTDTVSIASGAYVRVRWAREEGGSGTAEYGVGSQLLVCPNGGL